MIKFFKNMIELEVQGFQSKILYKMYLLNKQTLYCPFSQKFLDYFT